MRPLDPQWGARAAPDTLPTSRWITMPFLLLMPSYNQAHYIREAVDSCLAQDDPDWELWILDNSSDGTPDAMKAYTDPRIHFIHKPRRMDPGTCLNELLTLAKGEHFSYVHTDNRLMPGYVRKFRKALSGHPKSLAYCDVYHLDGEGRRIRHSRRATIGSAMLFSSDSLGVPFSATTELARAIGGFSSNDLADDVHFVVRADGLGPRVHIREPLVEYRLHKDSRTEAWGFLRVRQALYRSVLSAYRDRPKGMPDPYDGCRERLEAYLQRVLPVARTLAAHLLAGLPVGRAFWIDGIDAPSCWLAWACAEAGRHPCGFFGRGVDTLFGLPVRDPSDGIPEGMACLRPRRRGLVSGSVGPRRVLWLKRVLFGLPFHDFDLKRFPHDLAASLLIPQHAATPEGVEIWIAYVGALSIFLAFGAQTLACVKVGGWIGGQDSTAHLGAWPTVPEPPLGAHLWSTDHVQGRG